MKQPIATDRRLHADERAPIRERLTAQPPGASDEAVAGAMLRSAALVRPFGANEMAEVGTRLRSKERFRARPFALQLAIAACLVLFGGVLWAAVSNALRARSPDKREPPVVAPAAKPVRHASLGSSRPVSQIAPLPVEAEPLPALAPPSPQPVATRPSRDVAVREKAEAVAPAPSIEPTLAPPPASGPSALAQESRLLARALAELRQEGDAEEALAILDQHRTEFGTSGVLGPEANATRIEALLALGRHVQALALLDGQSLSATGVGREMLVARAELRADKGRRASALHDFDLLLRGDAPADSVTERAIYGRAVCRGRMGNWEEAQRDFERYLATFPNGKFADKARAAINR
jgi:tetratricopeptide (TPR) repeat protein